MKLLGRKEMHLWLTMLSINWTVVGYNLSADVTQALFLLLYVTSYLQRRHQGVCVIYAPTSTYTIKMHLDVYAVDLACDAWYYGSGTYFRQDFETIVQYSTCKQEQKSIEIERTTWTVLQKSEQRILVLSNAKAFLHFQFYFYFRS